MIDAVGNPQSLLLLGGTSDIALAVAEKYAATGGIRVVLAARPGPRRDEAAARLGALGHTVEVLDFDAADTAAHPALVERAAAGGDLDVALVAFGVLGDEEEAWQDHDAAIRLAQVNYVGPVSVGTALARQVRSQGHGAIVFLSSVAGEVVRLEVHSGHRGAGVAQRGDGRVQARRRAGGEHDPQRPAARVALGDREADLRGAAKQQQRLGISDRVDHASLNLRDMSEAKTPWGSTAARTLRHSSSLG